MPDHRSDADSAMNRLIRGNRGEAASPAPPAGHLAINEQIRQAAGLGPVEPDGENLERGTKPGKLRAGREQPSDSAEPAGMSFLLREEATAVRRGWRWRD